MDSPKYKVGDIILYNNKKRIIIGCNDGYLNQMTYLIREFTGDSLNGLGFGSIYDDYLETAWKEHKFDIDYKRLRKGKHYFWVAEKDLVLVYPDGSFRAVLEDIKKEINGDC